MPFAVVRYGIEMEGRSNSAPAVSFKLVQLRNEIGLLFGAVMYQIY